MPAPWSGAHLAPKVERVAHAAWDGLHQPAAVRQHGSEELAGAHDCAQRVATGLTLRTADADVDQEME